MKNMLKKSLATVMAVASLAGMAVMNASADTETRTDAYSKFEYSRYETKADCTLTNLTQKDRYAQASMTIYTADGSAYPSNYDPSLGFEESVSCTYNGSLITGVEYYGTLYFNTQPVGTPTSAWHTTL